MRAWLLLVMAGCGGAAVPVAPSTPAAVLTFSPLAEASIEEIIPLGNLNPPGHTFPSDHIYFAKKPQGVPLDVFAPSAGTVAWILSRESECKLMVRVNDRLNWYLDHIRCDPAIKQGSVIAAGQKLGVTTDPSHCLDLGVVDLDVTRRFIRPDRYPADTIHAAPPLRYYGGQLRDRLLALVHRTDKHGTIDQDAPGAIGGNWFLEGLEASDSFKHENWSKHLAFVHEAGEPAERRIAIGGTIAPAGVYRVASEFGKGGTFELLDRRDGRKRAMMVVEMIDGTHIRVAVDGGTPRVYAR